MKKLIALFALLLSSSTFAWELPGDIQTAILGKVSTVTQFGENSKLALTDTIISVGKYNGKEIIDGQIGFSGIINNENKDVSGANFIAGATLRMDTLLPFKFTDDYSFLKSIQHGPSCFYDFREKEFYLTYQVGLAFNLDPIK